MGGMGGGMGPPGVVPSNPNDPFAAGGNPTTSAVENFEIARPAAPRGPHVVTQEWDPAAPYLSQLRAASREAAFAVYMKNRTKYGNSPIFFLDCADYFFKQHNSEMAVQILSNLAEMDWDDPAPLRILGHRLALAGEFDLAVATLEKVLSLWPDDPQSYRDLALVLTQRADASMKGSGPAPSGYSLGGLFCHPAGRDSDYQRAADLLSEVVTRRWDLRYGQWELPALMELNRLLSKSTAQVKLDQRLLKPLDVDVRVVVTPLVGNGCVGMDVAEPTGQRAEDNAGQTAIGGLLEPNGRVAGPREYLLRKAVRGPYVVRTSEFGNVGGLPTPLTLRVDIFTWFGRPNEQCRSTMVHMSRDRASMFAGRIKF